MIHHSFSRLFLPTSSKSRLTRRTLSYPALAVQSFRTMASLSIELTAPNGVKYTQPTGLFINNEWVKAKSGETITSINPTCV